MDRPDDLRAKPSKDPRSALSEVSPEAHEAARRDMIETQLRRRGIYEAAVLAALGAVPRHEFVPCDFRNRA
jgi:hypothetical protein